MRDDDSQPLNFRPAFAEANIEPRDLLERKQLRRLGLPALSSVLAMMPVARVPDEFWTLDVNDEGYSVAIVACPCGITPQIEAGCAVVPCEEFPEPGSLKERMPEDWEPERCPRGYMFTGTALFVVNPQPRAVSSER